jgi:hypothetical protein
MQLPVSDDSHSQWTAERDIEQQDEALSPTDGYLHAYDSSRTTTASAAVPSVPDVFVNDPSLVGDEERHVRGSQRPVGNESIVRSSPSANQHLHRPSIKDPASPSSSHTSLPGSSYQQPSVSHLPTNRAIGETRSPDAPPAYQTLAGGGREAPLTSVGPPPSVMGVPEEQQRLLPLSHTREPQKSMGGSPSDGNHYPQRRTLCQRLIAILVGAVLVVSIISLVHGGPFGHKVWHLSFFSAPLPLPLPLCSQLTPRCTRQSTQSQKKTTTTARWSGHQPRNATTARTPSPRSPRPSTSPLARV